MKKLLVLLLALCLILAIVGCKKQPLPPEDPELPEIPENQEEVIGPKLTLPIDAPMHFSFLSGAGAWSTELMLYPDGTFTGSFHDSNMGEMGDEYPYGTVYLCDFEGRFLVDGQKNDTTYVLSLVELKTKRPVDEEWIEEQIRYVAAEPYGLEDGKTFLFYTPDTPTADLTEFVLGWWPLRFEEQPPTRLSCFGIENVEAATAFFSDPE